MPSISDAIIAGITSNIGPEAKTNAALIRGYIETQQQELIAAKADSVANISSMLSKAIAESQDQSVIDCYKKLLSQAVAV